jgi:hypothetical protein
MKTKQLLALLLICGASLMQSQTTLNRRVNASLDDHEEHITGSVPQTNTLGSMDAGSSDLELGNEKVANDPQLVGVRFTSITIPANAIINSAYIQFTVDDISKNTDPCVLTIQAEDNVNPATFNDNNFCLTSRTLAAASVTWNVSGSTWSVVGSAGTDQRTADIKSLVQYLVNKSGWTPGNAMAFYIKGHGTREVESYDGDAAKAPELVIQYNSGATGIHEENMPLSANIYPNPSKGSFNVSVNILSPSDVNISIYDLNGRIVEEHSAANAAAGQFTYTSAARLNPGMYFVKVEANNMHQFVKLIAE